MSAGAWSSISTVLDARRGVFRWGSSIVFVEGVGAVGGGGVWGGACEMVRIRVGIGGVRWDGRCGTAVARIMGNECLDG